MWRSFLITFINKHIFKKNIGKGKRKIKSMHCIYFQKSRKTIISFSRIVKYVSLLITFKGICHKIHRRRAMK